MTGSDREGEWSISSRPLHELDTHCGSGQVRVQRFLENLWRFQDAVGFGQAHLYGIPWGTGGDRVRPPLQPAGG